MAAWKHRLQARRKPIAAAILVAGFVTGAVLYLTGSPPPESLLGGQANESKQYLREVETYGGTANVLATEVREWFDSLWQGPRLGITVACLSALLAVVVFLVLTPLPRVQRDGQNAP